jgi:hypothetical protein
MKQSKALLFILIYFLTALKSFSEKIVIYDNIYKYYEVSTLNLLSSEISAANRLAYYLTKQSGKEWKTLDRKADSKKREIVISAVNRKPQDEGVCKIYVRKEQIVVEAAGNYLNTAVSFFLEIFMGSRVYSDTISLTPMMYRCEIPYDYNRTFIPAFKIRLMYERSAFDTLFQSWHGLSNIAGPLNNNKSLGWGLWVHTWFDLVPPERYFKSNPEFYSLRNGKRSPKQLCLSNKKVLYIAATSLGKLMQLAENVKYWSVSQMDNEEFCECPNCKKISSEERSESGAIVRFTNSIAKQFKNKVITTLAYQYSRTPPIYTKPDKNVIIVLCNLDSDRSKALDFSDATKSNFIKDLMGWKSVTQNLMIWDYVTSLNVVAGPFPNIKTLQPNLQFFRKMGIEMLFELGWAFKGAGYQDYRSYILAKLLWDPDANVDSLSRDFFRGYYGKAGNFLYEIMINMGEALENSQLPLSIYGNLSDHASGYLSMKKRLAYKELLSKAFLSVFGDKVMTRRVDAFAQTLRVADVDVNWNLIGSKEWANNYNVNEQISIKAETETAMSLFVEKAKVYGPKTMRENSLSPEQWRDLRKDRFEVNSEKNIARGSLIKFKSKYLTEFIGTGKDALIDGVLGTDDWSTTWQGWSNQDIDATVDFGKAVTINSISMRFMKDLDYGLVVPSQLELFSSDDNITYKLISKVQQPVLDLKEKKEVIVFNYKFSRGVKINYLRVIAKWPGYINVNGNKKTSYLFSDEIFVQ